MSKLLLWILLAVSSAVNIMTRIRTAERTIRLVMVVNLFFKIGIVLVTVWPGRRRGDNEGNEVKGNIGDRVESYGGRLG